VIAARLRHAGRVADALWIAALALAVVALALLVWPASARVPEAPAAAPRPATPATPAARPPRDVVLADSVVRADPFSPGRVAPRARWAPPAQDTLPPGLAPDPAAAAALGTGAGDAPEPPRFYGTVTDGAGPAALLRFPGAAASALYHAGDRERGWRVLRVSPTRVTVAAPDGARLTLRLPPNPTP
jgi:hypothetical protein